MQKKILCITLFWSLLVLSFSVSALPTPRTFSFYQGGYEEDAFVTGMFTGVDSNNDQTLAYLPFPPFNQFEITDFMMSFSGNSLVDAFTLQLSDLSFFAFAYDLDGGGLGDGPNEGIALFNGFGYSVGPAPLSSDFCPGPDCAFVDNPQGVESRSQELVMVTEKIPEPATLTLMGLGLAGIGYGRHRSNKAA